MYKYSQIKIFFKFFTTILILMVLACSCSNGRAMSSKDSNRQFGGECVYNTYDGVAKITRVEKTEESRKQANTPGGPGYEGYEVSYVISLGEPISESWAKDVATKQYPFTLKNSWYPGERYLEKYGLEVGAELPIHVQIITSGTCTPVILEFPTVDREDYFESGGKS
jgi:hypothetical protein